MSKVRINDLARELEVKSREILDALTAVGVTEKKTHSSSLESDEAERVRAYLQRGSRGSSESQNRSIGNGQKPKIDWSQVSKPGDAARELLRRKEEAAAAAASPRPAAPAAAPVPPPAVAKPAPTAARRAEVRATGSRPRLRRAKLCRNRGRNRGLWSPRRRPFRRSRQSRQSARSSHGLQPRRRRPPID